MVNHGRPKRHKWEPGVAPAQREALPDSRSGCLKHEFQFHTKWLLVPVLLDPTLAPAEFQSGQVLLCRDSSEDMLFTQRHFDCREGAGNHSLYQRRSPAG